MRIIAELILCGAALLLLVPGIVILVQTLAALLPAPRRPAYPAVAADRVTVIVPAHDEAAQIAQTVRLLAENAGGGDRILVVADNCTDQTAALAAAAGARVIERNDATRVGKGFAISFALQHLDAAPPEVVVLVDADCRVSAGGLATLARIAAATNRPVQAEYVLSAPENPGPLGVVNALAILLRNRVRPRGLRRLGLPCLLTGSGMAFPWRVLRNAPDTGSNLVEDMVMGLELALAGHAPLLCPEVSIASELPGERKAELKQRKRWEHGQLHTLATYAPRLFAAGLRRADPSLIGLGLDLAVPPLALLVMLQMAVLGAAGVAAALRIVPLAPVGLAAAALAAVAAAVGIAWIVFGRRTLPLRYALYVPFYLLWKIPLYLGLALRGKQKRWERTARRGADGG
jgi:cellulose synthase/poly-beta-1,6-N-acetylglucosamine synthase-like glycosyltransferase